MKVMICEGDENKAKVLSDLLNVYRFKLITLATGGDLVKQVQTHKPALIIFNEKFSAKPGSEVINRLRTNPVGSRTPVIFISDDTDQDTGSMDFTTDSLTELMKEPFKIKYLRHCIDRWTTFRSLHVRQ